MEKEHSKRVVTGLIKLGEVDEGVLVVHGHVFRSPNEKEHTTDAANEPFNQRRR